MTAMGWRQNINNKGEYRICGFFLGIPTSLSGGSHHFIKCAIDIFVLKILEITISGLNTQEKLINIYCLLLYYNPISVVQTDYVMNLSRFFCDEISIYGPIFPWQKVTDPIIEEVIVSLRRSGINLLRVCGGKCSLRIFDIKCLSVKWVSQ